jgi:hypothetical protein
MFGTISMCSAASTELAGSISGEKQYYLMQDMFSLDYGVTIEYANTSVLEFDVYNSAGNLIPLSKVDNTLPDGTVLKSTATSFSLSGHSDYYVEVRLVSGASPASYLLRVSGMFSITLFQYLGSESKFLGMPPWVVRSPWLWIAIFGGVIAIVIVIAVVAVKKHKAKYPLKERSSTGFGAFQDVDFDASRTISSPVTGTAPSQPQVVIREREIVNIVKVKCPFCGMLVEIEKSQCPNCGGAVH